VGFLVLRWPAQAAFFICLTFAQRALCAAAIFLRAAADSVLLRGLV
jgi:hypothetical protein